MKKMFALIGATALAAGATLAAETINGAGATFPAPIYQKWFAEYNKLHKDVQINYQPLGSGAGVQQVTAKTVFFGASDAPMTDQQLSAAPSKILHFPTVLGGVVPIYNVPGVTQEVKFSGAVLADIYLGKITKWNDPAIAKENAGVTFPAADIAVVHRSEGSGTSFIWTDFLSKVSPDFKSRVGASAQPSEALPNTARPAMKQRLRPRLSVTRPAGSSVAARTTAYTLMIHDTSGSVAGAKSCASTGSAMLTTHRSRMVRNWAADTTASTVQRGLSAPVTGTTMPAPGETRQWQE